MVHIVFVTNYSTNAHAAHRCYCYCYLSSVHNRYPAIYVCCQDSSEVLQSAIYHSFSNCKMHFVDNLFNNKAIILLNLPKYSLILAHLVYGLVGKVSGNILCDFGG